MKVKKISFGRTFCASKITEAILVSEWNSADALCFLERILIGKVNAMARPRIIFGSKLNGILEEFI